MQIIIINSAGNIVFIMIVLNCRPREDPTLGIEMV